jgi:hypothetical protein
MPAAQRLKRLTSGLAGAAVAMLLATAPSAHAAQTVLVIQDGADSGFNDPTPVEPVGGNDGETLGEQRRIAFQYAAAILASRVESLVEIRIGAMFDESLECSRLDNVAQATLAAAQPAHFAANFTREEAARPDTYYPVALANAIRGERINEDDLDNENDRDEERDNSIDIRVWLNPNLDSDEGCLGGNGWYYGLDGAMRRGQPSFVSTVAHELTHGLGFVSQVSLRATADSDVGQFPTNTRDERWPDIYSAMIRDLEFGDSWLELTDGERRDSLTNDSYVVWDGPTTTSQGAPGLSAGVNQGRVQLYAPESIRLGSSISHWDNELEPDQIMEPFVTGEEQVTRGIGLSACLLEDIGWTLMPGISCPDETDDSIAGGEDRGLVDIEQGNSARMPRAGDASESSSGGGGCTLVGEGRFDPVWLVLLLAAAGVLAGRRRRIV